VELYLNTPIRFHGEVLSLKKKRRDFTFALCKRTECENVDWFRLTQDRDQWWALRTFEFITEG
jgi:hypothetical protein